MVPTAGTPSANRSPPTTHTLLTPESKRPKVGGHPGGDSPLPPPRPEVNTNMKEVPPFGAYPTVTVSNRFNILESFTGDPKNFPPLKPNIQHGGPSLRPTVDSPSTGVQQRGYSNNSATPTISLASGNTNPTKREISKPPPIYISNFDGDMPRLTKSLVASYGREFKLKFLGTPGTCTIKFSRSLPRP